MKCRVASEKQVQKYLRNYVYSLSPVSIISIMYVCENKLHFGFEKMRKVADRVNNRYDDISKGYLKFDELKECLSEDDGIEIAYDLNFRRPAHTYDEARKNAEYTQKAFATAVFASVLCDKFLFHQTKVYQSIKWLETTFDRLKDRPSELKELLRKYEDQYKVKIT